MVLEAEIADRIELVLESITGEGAAILGVTLLPDSWQASYRRGSPRTERYGHPARLSLLEGEAAAALLTPVLARRWSLVYEEPADRFDLWAWRLPEGSPPTRDGRTVRV